MVDPIPISPISRSRDRSSSAGEIDQDSVGVMIGHNLKRLRTERGYTLENLSRLSGVSRAMLSQIELGRSIPTIGVVFKIAQAFEVSFSALLAVPGGDKAKILRGTNAKILTSASGEFSTRALFPFDMGRKAEFYLLRLAPHGTEIADAHPPGTTENLVVAKGMLEIEIGGDIYRLDPGDAVLFQADTSHRYHNPADEEALIYLVMTYVDTLG